MATNKTQAFIDYVVEELGLSEEEKPTLGNWGRVGTTLGALCLRLNLRNMEQINNLLEIQEETGALFGDVAQELGYLTEEQVRITLKIQKRNRRMEILDRLLLAGKIDEEQLKRFSVKVFEV